MQAMENRKFLVTGVALALGAVAIVVFSVFAVDSVSGGTPSVPTIFLRILVLALSAGTYVGILLYYGRRNAAFGEKLQAAVDTPLPEPQRKKKKRKR